LKRSKLEQFVYNRVRNNENVRLPLVRLYQKVFSLFSNPNPRLFVRGNLHNRLGFFYGFHDKCPFSRNGELLLAHKPQISTQKSVEENDLTEIGYFTGNNWSDFVTIGTTNASNWQLGSMLQWSHHHNTVAYNTQHSGAQLITIHNISTGELYNIDSPLCHISSCGYMSSYDFNLVNTVMPGYGSVRKLGKNYKRLPFKVIDVMSLNTLFEMAIDDVIGIEHQPSMNESVHFFHHSLFSPDSRYVFFLHRWVLPSSRRMSRLLIYDLHNKQLIIAPTGGMVSHLSWINNTCILGYMRNINREDGFYIFDVEDKSFALKPVLLKSVAGDGHPYCRWSDLLTVSDTYPDRSRYQYLYTFNPVSGDEQVIARFHLPLHMKADLQVDLHPRLHPHFNTICFDCFSDHTRSLSTLSYD